MKQIGKLTSSPPSAPAAVMDLFECIMSTIFDATRIAIPADARSGAYRIRVDNAFDMQFFPDQGGNLNIVANAISLPESVQHECLLQLLALNTWSPINPNISVAVDRSNASIQIWMRESLSLISGNDALRLLKLMKNAVIRVKEILASTSARPYRNGAVLQRTHGRSPAS